MKNPYEIVRDFEHAMAEYSGSKYAVAIDTGSAAIFLCCKYLEVEEVRIPKKTYLSVPCSIIHAGGKVVLYDIEWSGEYFLDPYPIIDSALRMRRHMHIEDTFRCLSFQYRKHLPIGRGGMILTDDERAVQWFKMARFHGRHEVPLKDDCPEMIGWHMYMEPERAAKGMNLMMNLKDFNDDIEIDYPDLSEYGLYEL